MPFDKLKVPSTAEGLRVDTERRFLPRFKNRGLAPSNVSIPDKFQILKDSDRRVRITANMERGYEAIPFIGVGGLLPNDSETRRRRTQRK